MAVFIGILLPFLGTAAGTSCVLFAKEKVNDCVQRIFLGFAGGVMTAASVWSLLIPALELWDDRGSAAWIPAPFTFLLGVGILILLDRFVPHLQRREKRRKAF